MTNKELILNKIKEMLETDEDIAVGYSELISCQECIFLKECEKEYEVSGMWECIEMIKKKLREDKEND